jgi:hypothetical protein
MRFNKREPKSKKAGGNGSPAGCPACDGGWRTVQFNWRAALMEPTGEWGRYPKTLAFKKNLKRGFLYECPACGQPWYLDEKKEIISVLPEKQLGLVEEWSSAPLLLNPDLWKKAKDIGATPPHQYAQDKNYVEIPCKVITRKGETIDKCLLTFTTAPPLSEDQANHRFLKDVADIQPSDFALPHAVRTTTSRSNELRGMGPTYVRSPEGSLFCLNWTVNFLDHKGALGKDMLLTPETPNRRPAKTPLISEETDKITFFMGDWSENLRELIQPG